MIAYHFLLYLMNDPYTLSFYMKKGDRTWNQFLQEEKFGLKALKNHWLQCSHLNDSQLPDHYFENANRELEENCEYSEMNPLQNVFLNLLPKAADEILVLDDKKNIVVKRNQWDNWMHISRIFSPLVIKVAYLWFNRREVGNISQAIVDNFSNTAIPGYENEIIVRDSLSDVHVHFCNGTEVDRKWVEVLNDPKCFINYSRTTNRFSDFSHHSIFNGLEMMSNLLLDAASFVKNASNDMDSHQLRDDSLLVKQAWFLYHFWLLLNGKKRKSDFFELHKFLLIEGAFRELYVMQYHQMGLLQFNKVLHTPFKGPGGNSVVDLLRQICGNGCHPIHLVEFRISPSQLASIRDYQEKYKKNGLATKVNFICSLIKNESSTRQSLYKHLEDINKAVREIKKYSSHIVGVDVAGSDYKAPPATFVQAMQNIRNIERKGGWNVTYHAGEDFFHILSGLRTIYEAIEFLKLKKNDRIGHASAAGVNPYNWSRCIHGVVPIKLGEYLDDLLFAIELIEYEKISELKEKRKKISAYINEVYGDNVSIEKMQEEWHLAKAERHTLSFYTKIVRVDCFQFFDIQELITLQKALLAFISKRGIVIEACPTSNIFIGYDHDMDSYHLKTWLKWKYVQALPMPDIVIGADEVGVFPTNLPNEYACIYEMMEKDNELKDLSEKILNDLVKNSEKYAFR